MRLIIIVMAVFLFFTNTSAYAGNANNMNSAITKMSDKIDALAKEKCHQSSMSEGAVAICSRDIVGAHMLLYKFQMAFALIQVNLHLGKQEEANEAVKEAKKALHGLEMKLDYIIQNNYGN